MRTLSFRTLVDRDGPPELGLESLLEGRDFLGGSLPGPAAQGQRLVFFEEAAWLEMQRGARSNLRSEQVGVLFGKTGQDRGCDWLHVQRAPHAQGAPSTAIHAELDGPAWDRVHEQLSEADRSLDVLGWWHTHPDLGAFFSGTDRATQARAFTTRSSLGLVIDPVRHEWAAFEGPLAEEREFAPIVLSRHHQRAVDTPAHALLLPLAANAPSLQADAWNALAGNGPERPFLLPPRPPAPLTEGQPVLVFDRPRLKRRYPALKAHLSSPRLKGRSLKVALPLTPSDVVGVFAYGRLRAPAPFFAGAISP